MTEEKRLYYNSKFVPMPAGFNNTGATCHWNALMQCLLSCSCINEELINHSAGQTNEFAKEYYKLLVQPTPNQSSAVLAKLINELRIKRINMVYGFNQESASEGFIHFIDLMPDYIKTLFSHRYERYNICGNCNFKSVRVKEETFHIELFEKLFENINNSNDFVYNLINRVDTMPDYKCSNCEKMHPNTKRYEHLRMASEIILVMFNKYGDKKVLMCPESFNIPSIENDMKYCLVGQVRHVGNLGSGHYWALVKRGDGYIIANDSSISPAVFDQSESVYMAFYCQVHN